MQGHQWALFSSVSPEVKKTGSDPSSRIMLASAPGVTNNPFEKGRGGGEEEEEKTEILCKYALDTALR